MSSRSKVIFWNIWGHRYADDIHAFLKQHEDADVFCLTEVTDITEREIAKNGHNLVFSGDEAASQVNGLAQLRKHFGDSRQIFYNTADYRQWKCLQSGDTFKKVGFGSALLIHNDVFIIDMGVHRVDFEEKNLKNRVIQWMVYQKGNGCYLLAHLHGVWIKGNTKGDHDARTHQSREIRWLLQSLSLKHNINKVIFGGDLNLDIDTKALQLIEMGERMGDIHYANLIANHCITSTRTLAYRNHGVEGHSLFADYVFVTGAVHVESLQAKTNIMASDHAPLIVTFS